MTMIAGTLVRRSYVLAGIVDVMDELESYYAIEGINSLNEIISSWGGLGIYIPYESTLTLPLQVGVSEYIVTPVIAQFLKGNIKYGANISAVTDLRQANLKQYNLFSNTFSGIPSLVYISGEKVVVNAQTGELGSKLIFAPTPSSNYTATITLKYVLDRVSLTDQLNQFPDYYQKPLEFQLAKDLSLRFKTKMSDLFMDEYTKIMDNLMASNPIDMTVNVYNEFYSNRAFKPWNSYAN